MTTSRHTVRVIGPEAGDGLRVTDPGARFRLCVCISGVNAPVPGDEIEVILRSHKRILARILTTKRITHGLFMHVHAEIIAEGQHV